MSEAPAPVRELHRVYTRGELLTFGTLFLFGFVLIYAAMLMLEGD